MRSCNQSGTTHSVFIRSRMVSRTALKLFSFGFLLMMTLKVSYTSCQINRWHKNCYKVFHRNPDIWTNGVRLGCIKEGDTEMCKYAYICAHIPRHHPCYWSYPVGTGWDPARLGTSGCLHKDRALVLVLIRKINPFWKKKITHFSSKLF